VDDCGKTCGCGQWHTQKIFMGEVSFSGIWWSFVFGVRYLLRHNFKLYSCLPTNFFEKFVDTLCMFFCTHSPQFMCHCTEYKLSALQVTISEENKLNATTQQFIIAKISVCALKQGFKHTLITASEQFTTAKSSSADLSLNTSSGG